ANGEADFPHGPDPPPFRAARLERKQGRDPVLDYCDRACGARPGDVESPMITAPALAGKRFAVLGLARSGLAAAESLLASGAEVTAWDRQEDIRSRLEGRARIDDPMDIDL